MNVEWDEELVERAFEPWAPAFVGRHREEGCGNWCHEGGEPFTDKEVDSYLGYCEGWWTAADQLSGIILNHLDENKVRLI